MNVQEVPFAVPPYVEKLQEWFTYGLAWVQYYGRLLSYCLLTSQGRSRFMEWPLLVWMTLLVAGLLTIFIVGRLLRPSLPYRGRHIRGTRLVMPRGYWYKHWFWSSKALVIGQVRWPKRLEPKNLLLIGAPGTGKSQALHGVLDPLRVRGDVVIMTDIGGEALGRFGRNGDHLLNPLDARSESWSPFAEMDSATDADRVAKSMIPDQEGKEREWIGYCQALTSAVLRRLWEQKNATNETMLYFLTAAPSPEVLQLVQGLPAQALCQPGAERMFSSVRGIIGTYLTSYTALRKDAGPTSWSIRRYIHEGSGWLWLPYREDQAATLRPLLATWLGEAANAILSLPSDLGRRRWLLLDEVATLGCVQGMSDALTKGRKNGLCAILGLQTVSQLETSYGAKGAQTLLGCLASQLILRANDPETAKYASDHLGDCVLEHVSVSHGKQGETRTKVRTKEELVLPSDIQGLPDREGYLRLAGQKRVRCVTIPLVKRKSTVRLFVPRGKEPPAPPPPSPPASPTPSDLPPRPALDADAIFGTP